MYVHLLRRVVIMLAVLVSVICFFVNLSHGGDFFYSAFMALCVLFASSLVIMYALQAITGVLFKHLEEKRRVHRMMAERHGKKNEDRKEP